jgi:predicted nuclease of predicted toxin-antitoxin system
MARFYSDEDFPAKAVAHLRGLGHDVVTIQESGLANKGTPDSDVLAFAISQSRAVLTMNRKHFIRLHRDQPDHFGIVICTTDADVLALAERIDRTVVREHSIAGQLVRINRPG